MRILDRYILRELLGPFVFGVAAFTAIFIGTGTLFKIAQYISTYGAGLVLVTKLLIFSLPGIVVLTFPMAMLLATLMAFARLSSNSEITAMKSGGQSFLRLATPVFIAAFFVSIMSLVFHEFVVPRANAAYNHIVYYEIEKNSRPKTQEHIVLKDVKNGHLERLTYARRFDEATNTMETVTIQEFEADRLVRVENVQRAVWTGDQWIMYNGVIHDLSSDGSVDRTMHFEKQVMPVTRNPEEIAQEQKKPEEMTIKELKQQIQVLKQEYVSTNLYEVELHQRIAVAMASFVFSLIGAPLGLQPHRSSSSIGFGLSVMIIFIYYGIFTFNIALGQGGTLPPLLAAWIPNIIGIIIGLFLIYRASR